jgi:hypothetical protein
MAMTVPSIEPEEVGPLWAANFPKRKRHYSSLSVCIDLCRIAQSTAQELFTESDDAQVRLSHALDILGIPESEFYKLQKELRREL